jgi:hypothetical protein
MSSEHAAAVCLALHVTSTIWSQFICCLLAVWSLIMLDACCSVLFSCHPLHSTSYFYLVVPALSSSSYILLYDHNTLCFSYLVLRASSLQSPDTHSNNASNILLRAQHGVSRDCKARLLREKGPRRQKETHTNTRSHESSSISGNSLSRPRAATSCWRDTSRRDRPSRYVSSHAGRNIFRLRDSH